MRLSARKMDSRARGHIVTAEEVADVLASCLAGRPHYLSPAEESLEPLVLRLNIVLDGRWKIEDIKELRAMVKKRRAEEKVLRSAAQILMQDLEEWRRHGMELRYCMNKVCPEMRETALEVAITLLTESRVENDNPDSTIRISDKGPDPEPWALDAAYIAAAVIRTLRSCGDSRAGVGRKDGPVVKFVSHYLRISMGSQSIPKPSTIHDAIHTHLPPAFKHNM